MLQTSPNQRLVLIQRDIPSKASHKPYLCIYTDALQQAAKELTPAALKLYLYLASNQHNYQGAFSSQHFSNEYNCDVKTARTAFHTLAEKGYLVQSPNQKNLYIFYEKPQITNEEKKKFKDEETGQSFYFTFAELVEACEGNIETATQLWN